MISLVHHCLLLVQDDALFQRNFQQLQVYYTDLRSSLPPSELRETLLGLNLVRLLVANRIADFHIELETLGPDDQAHPAIAFPKQLEQALMEGTYRQVVASCKSAPSPYMTPLLTQLAETVRDELAGCASAVRRSTFRVHYQFSTEGSVASMLCWGHSSIASGCSKLYESWKLILARERPQKQMVNGTNNSSVHLFQSMLNGKSRIGRQRFVMGACSPNAAAVAWLQWSLPIKHCNCMQAYSKLLLRDAAKMLGFEKQQELLAYCDVQGWATDAQYVHFAKATPPDAGKAHLDVFKHMLTYARELDRII
jgi:hypothetical protein